MRRIQTLAVLTVFLLSLPTGYSAAATPATSSTPLPPLNLTISPDAQDLVVKPGGSLNVDIHVRNNGLQTEYLKAVIKTFKASGQNGIPQLLDIKSTDDFGQWASLSKPTFDAEPNVWQTYSVNISPPSTAAFGYYYAIDFSRAKTTKSQFGNTFLTSIDSLVLVDVKAPGEQRKANLAEFSTPNNVVEFLPENFTIRMHNTGNVHVAPRGNIDIYKGKKSVASLDVNSSGGNILPSSYRTYTAQWKDGNPVYKTVLTHTKDGKPEDSTKLDWSNFTLSKLRFGKYTAQLEMIYNNGSYDVPLTTQLSFWVIPWRIIIGLVIILLLVLAGLGVLFIPSLRARIKGKRRGDVRLR